MYRKYWFNFIGSSDHPIPLIKSHSEDLKHRSERYECLWQDLGSVDAADPRKCQPEPGTAAGSHHDGPRTQGGHNT